MPGDASRWLDDHQADLAAGLAINGDESGLIELVEELGHIGHWKVSLPDYAVTWSSAIYNIHGVTPDNFKPDLKTAIGFYHPEDQKAVWAAVDKALRDGKPFELSVRLTPPTGGLCYVICRGVRIPGPDGTPKAIFGVFIDVTEQHEMNLQLGRIAYVDALTRLANRRRFDETLEREWRRAARTKAALSLIIMDIDRFKSFNDLYGHPAGDECLRTVGEALARVGQRPGDLAARYGGEEFALILPDTDAAGAASLAQAVRGAIADLELGHAGNPAYGGVVTASLGVSTAYPGAVRAEAPWRDLIAEADALLYEAKRTGRNKVVSLANIGCDGATPLQANEANRLEALAMYERAGATRRTAELNRIAKLAARLTSSPIGLVSLVGRDEQRFAGNFGLEGVEATGRDVSFCAHTILQDDPLVVPDATRDSRFQANALVTGDAGLRYYAGAPIISETTGHRLGAVCILDKSARTKTTPAERAVLTELAKMAASILSERLRASTPT